MYVLGFSIVFILFGSLFGLGGAVLYKYRSLLGRLGGVLVIFFGLVMLGAIKFNFLYSDKRFHLSNSLVPGRLSSSFLLGATFAFGWTPCVGPILGSVLTLAAASATVYKGMLLLAVFSSGLALPFLAAALGGGWAMAKLKSFNKYLHIVSVVGGVVLVIFGLMLVFNVFSAWAGYVFNRLDFLQYERLINYL